MTRSNQIVNHGAAGKGDKDRTINIKAFRANYDAIDWGLANFLARRKRAQQDYNRRERAYWYGAADES